MHALTINSLKETLKILPTTGLEGAGRTGVVALSYLNFGAC